MTCVFVELMRGWGWRGGQRPDPAGCIVLGRGMKFWLLQVRQIRGGQEWKQRDKGSKGERIVAWARTAIKGWWVNLNFQIWFLLNASAPLVKLNHHKLGTICICLQNPIPFLFSVWFFKNMNIKHSSCPQGIWIPLEDEKTVQML